MLSPTRIWVNMLQSEGGIRVLRDDKRDPPPRRIQISQAIFSFYVFQTNFQKKLTSMPWEWFSLGIDATHNVTQYKGILLFTLMTRDNWGHGM